MNGNTVRKPSVRDVARLEFTGEFPVDDFETLAAIIAVRRSRCWWVDLEQIVGTNEATDKKSRAALDKFFQELVDGLVALDRLLPTLGLSITMQARFARVQSVEDRGTESA